jgi:hypothetical protein
MPCSATNARSARHLRLVGFAKSQGLGVALLGFGDLVAPRPHRIELGGLGLEELAGLLDVLAAQSFERRAVHAEQMLALELEVHPPLADREGAAHLGFEVAIDELLVLEEETDPRREPACSMRSASLGNDFTSVLVTSSSTNAGALSVISARGAEKCVGDLLEVGAHILR